MNYLSVCSGIGSDTLAAPPGWQCVGYAETAPFPAAVLGYRFPTTHNFGDLNDYQNWQLAAQPDIAIAGTPCQSFSAAGAKRGMDDPRGQLTLTYFEMVARIRPRWFVWENVPNALNTALPHVINEITERGYCCAWRIMDSLGWGVPQQRRRLFLVGHLGNWRSPAAVLFDGPGRGWIPHARDTGKDAAGVSRTLDRAYTQTRQGGKNVFSPGDATGALMASMYKSDSKPIVFTPHGNASRVDAGGATGTLTQQMGTGGGNVPMVYCPGAANQNRNVGGVVHKQDHLGCLDGKGGVGGATKAVVYCPGGSNRAGAVHEQTHMSALDGGGGNGARPAMVYANPDCTHADIHHDQGGLRFLTPEECERLQGIPDFWTAIPWRGKPADQCPTGHRYQAIGNAICVPVLRWLLERIQFVDSIQQ